MPTLIARLRRQVIAWLPRRRASWDMTALLNAAAVARSRAERHLWLVRLTEWLRSPGPARVDDQDAGASPWPLRRLQLLLNALDKHAEHRAASADQGMARGVVPLAIIAPPGLAQFGGDRGDAHAHGVGWLQVFHLGIGDEPRRGDPLARADDVGDLLAGDGEMPACAVEVADKRWTFGLERCDLFAASRVPDRGKCSGTRRAHDRTPMAQGAATPGRNFLG